MKKYIFVLMVVALFFTSTAFAENNGDYLYLASYESVSFIPETINTGDIVSMSVDLKNRGTYLEISDLNAELIIDTGLEGINTTFQINEIKPGITKKLIFEFKISEDLPPGNYNSTLNLTYNRLDEEVFQQEEIIISVVKSNKKVDIVVSPSVISPGSKENITFTITNLTNQPISNLSFVWEEENDLILPLGSDNKKFVSILTAKQSVELVYLVAADPNIITGIYPITAITTMNDNNGVTSQESTLGLIVGGNTDFEISVDTSDSLLSINIANIGTNDAESVIIKISGQGIILENNTEIIGNLERGDYTIASFETTSLNSKEVKIEIHYTDTTGERQSITKTISLGGDSEKGLTKTLPDGTTVNSSENFRGKGMRSAAFPTNTLIILVVLIVGSIIYYKKRNMIRGKIKKLKK